MKSILVQFPEPPESAGIFHIFLFTQPLHSSLIRLKFQGATHLTMAFGPFLWRLALLTLPVVTAAPAVSLQDPAGQELIFLSLAINAAMMGPFALVENEPPVDEGGRKS